MPSASQTPVIQFVIEIDPNAALAAAIYLHVVGLTGLHLSCERGDRSCRSHSASQLEMLVGPTSQVSLQVTPKLTSGWPIAPAKPSPKPRRASRRPVHARPRDCGIPARKRRPQSTQAMKAA